MTATPGPGGALLLDLDGTLVDSTPHWVEIFLATFQQYGIAMTREQYLEEVFHAGGALPDVLARHGLADEVAAFRATRDRGYVSLLRDRIEWLPGARTLLRDARAAGPLGIITNSWRAYVEAIDARLDVSSQVGCLLALEDQGPSHKPGPDGLLAAAAKLEADPGRCVYVGDHRNDMVAARAAGMQAWLVPMDETERSAWELADRTFEDRAQVGSAWAELVQT